MGAQPSAHRASPLDGRIHPRFTQLAAVREPHDSLTRDLIVGLLGAPGAEDFGALLFDSFKCPTAAIDEQAYTHGVLHALGFTDDDTAAPPRANYFFNVFSGGKDTLTRPEFTRLAHSTASLSLAAYFPGFQPIGPDSSVVRSIVTSAMADRDAITVTDFGLWEATNCPYLFSGVMKWIEIQCLVNDGQSESLSPPLPALLNGSGQRELLLKPPHLWLLSSSLPGLYRNAVGWTLLYNSVMHGHGANRFFHHVLHYKGPTVLVVRDVEGDFIVACVDGEWQDHSSGFGGPQCQLLTVLPAISHYRSAVKVAVDLKTRHVAHGIAIGVSPNYYHGMLFLNSDLASGIIRFDPTLPPGTTKQIHINTVEVWGCGNKDALAQQAVQRIRDLQLAEERQKVRNPEQWLENPDRYILGLADLCVDSISRIARQTR